MAITKFGEFMRILRIKRGILMKDTANVLGVQTPFLSAVENGKRKIPDYWYEKIVDAYNLSEKDKDALRNAIDDSVNNIKFDLNNCDNYQRNLVLQFQRSFQDIDEKTSKKIIEILEGKK